MKTFLLSWHHLSISFHFLIQWDNPYYYLWVNPEREATDSLEGFQLAVFIQSQNYLNSRDEQAKMWNKVQSPVALKL